METLYELNIKNNKNNINKNTKLTKINIHKYKIKKNNNKIKILNRLKVCNHSKIEV